MGRKVIYWVVRGLLALSAVFAGVNYLAGSQQAVPNRLGLSVEAD